MEKSEILSQIENLKQKPQLNRRERRYLAKLESKLHLTSNNSISWKGTLTKIVLVFFGILFFGGIGWYVNTRPNLPPIDMEGHVEQNPPSHISDQEIPEAIQKHMLEHADGKGKPGVVIQYNCKKYNCEENMFNKLKRLVKKYPENVYLAPGNYDGKIILTRLGKRNILDKFDEKKIEEFIL